MLKWVLYLALILFATIAITTFSYSQESQIADSTCSGDTTALQGIDFVSIPEGTFQMGSNDGEKNERPIHTVTVSAFEMSMTEITVGQFRRFVQATRYYTDIEKKGGGITMVYSPIAQYEYRYSSIPWKKVEDASWRNSYLGQADDHPVVSISWNDAMAYCRWLSEQTGEEYDLPTEAEWEYACRAGSTKNFCTGDSVSDLELVGWYYGNNNGNDRPEGQMGQTHPVGQKDANAFGLYDMHGSVMEWCKDWFGRYSSNSEIDPQGPEKGSKRVLRGGMCYNNAYNCRSARRYESKPILGRKEHGLYGFRIVRRHSNKSD